MSGEGEAVNVRVAVRCRPLSSKEIGRGCKAIVSIQDRSNISISGATGISSLANSSMVVSMECFLEEKEKKFTFDFVYGSDSIQQSGK